MKTSITGEDLAALKREYFERGYDAAARAILDGDAEPGNEVLFDPRSPAYVASRNAALASEGLHPNTAVGALLDIQASADRLDVEHAISPPFRIAVTLPIRIGGAYSDLSCYVAASIFWPKGGSSNATDDRMLSAIAAEIARRINRG